MLSSNGSFGSCWPPSQMGGPSTASSRAVGEKKSKRKRPKFIRKVTCQVCGDIANDHIHYGALACYSCRAFFRRGVNANAPYYCSQNKTCVITKQTRKHCQYCRFQKCLSVGMKGTWVMTEEDKKEKKEKAMIRRLQKKKKSEDKMMTPHHKLSSKPNRPTSSHGMLLPPYPMPNYTHHSPQMPHRDYFCSSSISNINYNEADSDASSALSCTYSNPKNSPSPPINSPSPSSASFQSRPSPTSSPSSYMSPSAYPVVPSNSSAASGLLNDVEQDLRDLGLEYRNAYVPKATDYIPSPCPSPPAPSSSTEVCPSASHKDLSLLLRPSSPGAFSDQQPIMAFTNEERNFVDQIIGHEIETTREITVNPTLIMSMIEAAKSGSVVPYNDLLEGYTVCMKRIIKFASRLEFFQGLNPLDQRNLLLSNTDMVVNIRSARLLRPGNNLHLQIEHAVGGGRAIEDFTKAVQPHSERIEYKQVYQSPWACNEEHEKQFASLMENLFNLEMDRTTTSLMGLIVLFSCNNIEIKEKLRCTNTQEFFTQMLYRYLRSTVGKKNAVRILPKYMYLISQLEEMAQIMVTKRLML